jgi:hypothetical protein
MKKTIFQTQLLLAAMVAVILLSTVSAYAAAPGIKGTSFSLVASPAGRVFVGLRLLKHIYADIRACNFGPDGLLRRDAGPWANVDRHGK